MGEKTKIFFPNLDGLRFFSFFIVFLAHSFSTDNLQVIQSWQYQFFKTRLFSDGDLGVSFFFVLSGFLITYLLLMEKKITGKIDVRSFYIRRILRIWPLYYFCVLFGFLIFPVLKKMLGQIPDESASPFLCSVFLNNFNHILNGPPDSSVLSVLWSVAIEEQFYLIWPVLFYFIVPKNYKFVFLTVVCCSLLYRMLFLGKQIELHSLGVISDMAIGGIGAYLAIQNNTFLDRLKKSSGLFNAIPYLAALIFIVFKNELFYAFDFLTVFKRLIIAFFFCWIILEQNFCENSLFKISKLKNISILGKYTYGLYCLHPIGVLTAITLTQKTGLNQQGWQLLLIQFPLSLALSIGIAYLSYRFYESRFLRLKEKFAYITKNG